MSETVECTADQHKIFQHTADRETAEVDTLMKTSVDGGARSSVCSYYMPLPITVSSAHLNSWRCCLAKLVNMSLIF